MREFFKMAGETEHLVNKKLISRELGGRHILFCFFYLSGVLLLFRFVSLISRVNKAKWTFDTNLVEKVVIRRKSTTIGS